MHERLPRPFCPDDKFELAVVDEHSFMDAFTSLLAGQIPALLLRNAMSQRDCDEFVTRYELSGLRRPRPDGVPGTYLGAYHYRKTLEGYLAEMAYFGDTVDALFNGLSDPRERVARALGQLPEHPVLRPAQWDGHPASSGRVLAWTASGELLLDPHDDIGQLREPSQHGFEAQRCADNLVLAFNFYPHVDPGGGQLTIWNCSGTDSLRSENHIEFTGFPYPQDLLNDALSIDIPVSSGTVAIIHGKLLHAVRGYPPKSPGRRILMNLFYGRLSPREFVSWA